MFKGFPKLALLAAFVGASVAGCAEAYDGPHAYSEILPELPANAPPGECYAKVGVPGEAGPPPVVQSAQWVLNPGPPGSPGPIWCLEPITVAVAPAPPPIERYGWIRVLCDTDATPARIGQIQHRLHDRGFYAGAYTGRYDQATAEGVARFQAQAHIAHGGYLSLETVQALDSAPAYAAGPAQVAPPIAQPAYPYPAAQSYPVAQPYPVAAAYPAQAYAGPCACQTPAPPPPPPVVYQQAPCCVAPPPPVAYPCCQAVQGYQAGYGYSVGYSGGYGFGAPVPAYAAASASASAYAGAGAGAYAGASASAGGSMIQNGWLTWASRGRY